MKITAVETFLLRFPVDPYTYGASSKGWIRDRSSLLVRVKTDAGVEGWGEGGQEPLLEFDRNPSPLRDELSTEPIRFEHGVVRVPQAPGLGIAINQGVLERYRVA